MCSFGVTSKIGLLNVNDYAKKRGPDLTSYEHINNIELIHNLLHVTGEKTVQPLKQDNILCLYNGEIYNYQNFSTYKSDGECIIPLYKMYGEAFGRVLDGEFAIVLIDFVKGIILTITDCFGTKPLWYSFEKEFGIASFKSQLLRLGFKDIVKQKHNTTNIFSIDSKELIESFNNYSFELTQYKNSFDDWNRAFKQSIKKRTESKYIFTGLSSGFDSGLINLEMTNQNINYAAYSITENEREDIIKSRLKFIKNMVVVDVDPAAKQELDLLENDEYDFKSNKTSLGIYSVFKRARQQGNFVFISGHGADEIISDYGYNGKKIYEQSAFGGLFPEKLESVFPWNNFFEGLQRVYISKEESIASYFGIESRYPFLDFNVVQEFLWLAPQLKNKEYKSCIQNYLRQYNFPIAREKIGWPAAACPIE